MHRLDSRLNTKTGLFQQTVGTNPSQIIPLAPLGNHTNLHQLKSMGGLVSSKSNSSPVISLNSFGGFTPCKCSTK